jgi:hypothetical protein
MANNKVNIGCGTAVLIFAGVMLVIAALIYAGDHMDTVTSFIVGTIIVVLILVIMVQRK